MFMCATVSMVFIAFGSRLMLSYPLYMQSFVREYGGVGYNSSTPPVGERRLPSAVTDCMITREKIQILSVRRDFTPQ